MRHYHDPYDDDLPPWIWYSEAHSVGDAGDERDDDSSSDHHGRHLMSGMGGGLEIRIVDEKGQTHSQVHGVSAIEWLKMIRAAALALKDMGVDLTDNAALCDDPDCPRLNRRAKPAIALYQLSKDLTPVRPTIPTSDKERQICEGHPHLAGSYLCRDCAIVATAKRLIDSRGRPHE